MIIQTATNKTLKRVAGAFNLKAIKDGEVFIEEGTNRKYKVRKSIYGFKYIEYIS